VIAWPRIEILALCAVVATLPFHLYTWGIGGQSVSPTEAAILMAMALIGVRRSWRAATPQRRSAANELTKGQGLLAANEPTTGQGLLAASAPTARPGRPAETAAGSPRDTGGRREAGSQREAGGAREGGDTGACDARTPLDQYSHNAKNAVAPRVDPSRGFAAYDGPIILFLAATLLSLLATEYLRLSLRELRTLIVEPVLFWYLCRAVVRSPRDVGWLVGTLIGVTSLVAIVGLVQFVRGGAVTDVQGVRRVLGSYTSPNHFALLLGRALPFLLAAGWCLPRWRPWAGIGAVLCAGALLATFSVGGWLGTGLAVLVVVGLLGGRKAVLALVAVGAIAAAVVFFAIPVERISGRLDPSQGTSFARVQLWQAGIELMRESPLLGIGLDNFLYRYPVVLPPDAPFEPNLSHPHNLVLQFGLSLGLAGLAALGWLLWRFAGQIWRPARDRDGSSLERALAVGALGSMTDFVAHGLVDNSYFLPDMAVIFWLTLAVAAVLNRRSA
jgi:O-antigen ligase